MILSERPVISVATGALGLGQSLIDYGMPVIQALIAVGSLVIIVLTIILQVRKLKRK